MHTEFAFDCPNPDCRQNITVSTEYCGIKTPCPTCGENLTVPSRPIVPFTARSIHRVPILEAPVAPKVTRSPVWIVGFAILTIAAGAFTLNHFSKNKRAANPSSPNAGNSEIKSPAPVNNNAADPLVEQIPVKEQASNKPEGGSPPPGNPRRSDLPAEQIPVKEHASNKPEGASPPTRIAEQSNSPPSGNQKTTAAKWTTDLQEFSNELARCIERQPRADINRNGIISRLAIQRKGKEVYEIFKGDAGKTTQGKLNDTFGGTFSFRWTGKITKTSISETTSAAGFLVQIPPPIKIPKNWELPTTFLAVTTRERFKELKLKVGDSVTVSGKVKGEFADPVNTGLFAFHSLIDEPSFIRLNVAQDSVEVEARPRVSE